MSAINSTPKRTLWAERVAFTNGMLLDQRDFATEQEYHRGRLSVLARYLNGTGTVAGLNVERDGADPRKIAITPGLGIDRAGRIVQSPLPLCLNVDRWFEDQVGADKDAVERAFNAAGGGTPDHFLADVFLGFRECERAKRPAFAGGEFDALGSVAPLRLRDAVAATMVLRGEDTPLLPKPGVPEVSGANFAARRADLDAKKRGEGWVEDDWWDDFDGEIKPDVEHPNADLAADLFLARIKLPAETQSPPKLNSTVAPTIENDGRRMVYSTADLIALVKEG